MQTQAAVASLPSSPLDSPAADGIIGQSAAIQFVEAQAARVSVARCGVVTLRDREAIGKMNHGFHE